MIRIITLILLATFTLTAQADEGDCCICEKGAEPRWQRDFFHAGCVAWLANNSCPEYSKIESITNDGFYTYDNQGRECPEVEIDLMANFRKLPNTCKKLKIGYVGHWGSSLQLASHINYTIKPFLESTNIPVEIDNTACLGMNDPNLFQQLLSEINLKDGQYLKVTANQTISLGVWDLLLPGRINLTATYDSRSGITYPECNRFGGQPCESSMQGGSVGKCQEASGTQSVRCCSSGQRQNRGPRREMRRQRIPDSWTLTQSGECPQ